ncbi:hypothetical protein BOTNAR_0240g00130 [Botryotinia narcissicola]|uniref:Uncharacterized protein n=1 Tax=Botryotinia narcissicola TaxID=278944 RepID=A0A4Z1I2T3_9HELO|nr:hypothetical protein BOTNAR_0240g00130 [Botryotinia narcissicola]
MAMLLSDWPKSPALISLVPIYLTDRDLQAPQSYTYAPVVLTKHLLCQQYIASVLTGQEIRTTRQVFGPLTLAATNFGEAKD